MYIKVTRACTVSKRSCVVLRSCGSLLVFILWTTACNVLSYCMDSNKKCNDCMTSWLYNTRAENIKISYFWTFPQGTNLAEVFMAQFHGILSCMMVTMACKCILLHYSHACDDHCYSYCSNALLTRLLSSTPINSSLPGQYGRRFADDLFRGNFVNERFCNLILISLKFIPMGTIDNKAALVQVMAWRWIGNKPLPEPMLTQFTDVLINRRPITVRAAPVGLLLTLIYSDFSDNAYNAHVL